MRRVGHQNSFLVLIFCVFSCFLVSGCTEVLNEHNATQFRFSPDFQHVLNHQGQVDRNQISVLVLKPTVREVNVFGGYDTNLEDSDLEIKNADLKTFFGNSGGLGLVYHAEKARCGFTLPSKPFLERVYWERPALDVGFIDSKEIYMTSVVKFSDALEQKPDVQLDSATDECLKKQGRFVLTLKHDVLQEMAYVRRSATDSWDKYKQGVVKQFAYGNASVPHWDYFNVVLFDTQNKRVLVKGIFVLNTLEGVSENIWKEGTGKPWGAVYRAKIDHLLTVLPRAYQNVVEATSVRR